MDDLASSRIDRDGSDSVKRSLLRLGLRAHRLESCLRMIEWGGPSTGGLGPCPWCGRFPPQGHAENCFVAEVLRPSDTINQVEEALNVAQELLRHSSVQMHIDGIQASLADISLILRHATTLLERT